MIVDLGERGRFHAIPADELTAPICGVCERTFTAREWEARHWWGDELDPVHEGCCPDNRCR